MVMEVVRGVRLGGSVGISNNPLIIGSNSHSGVLQKM